MRPESKIVPMNGYFYGALEYPAKTLYDNSTGDWYAMHTDGRIFNCHPKTNDRWPIRFQKYEYDADYHHIKEMINM